MSVHTYRLKSINLYEYNYTVYQMSSEMRLCIDNYNVYVTMHAYINYQIQSHIMYCKHGLITPVFRILDLSVPRSRNSS